VSAPSIDACLTNAEELLAGARRLLTPAIQPRLAYHLAALALEELGKARVLGLKIVAERHGRELPGSIGRAMDDHVRKLFWAFWGPSMADEQITPEQFDSYVGLAQRIHDKRLRALYVDIAKDGAPVPQQVIPADEVQAMIDYADARLQIERIERAGPEPTDNAGSARAEWFFEVTDDPDRRQLIFGRASLNKLHELGNVPAWATWLKETFDKHDADSRALIDAEMRRVPDSSQSAKNKWQTTFRLHTDSHSIRQNQLNVWNDGVHWIRLRAVSNKSDQLLVDFDVRSDLSLEQLWAFGFDVSRTIAMALNVGTLGFFWFHLPLDHAQYSGRYYEKMLDVDTRVEVAAHRTPALRVNYGQRRVLDAAFLRNVMLCTGTLLRERRVREAVPQYLQGMAHIAKTDVHLSFEYQSVASFYHALRSAMTGFGDWDQIEPYPVALRRFVAQGFSSFDAADLEKLIDVGESMLAGKGIPQALTMDDALKMKIACDVYLLKAFRRMEQQQFGERADDAAP
jgi:AbiV family abortive infection protein